jgi:hypothetical protein
MRSGVARGYGWLLGMRVTQPMAASERGADGSRDAAAARGSCATSLSFDDAGLASRNGTCECRIVGEWRQRADVWAGSARAHVCCGLCWRSLLRTGASGGWEGAWWWLGGWAWAGGVVGVAGAVGDALVSGAAEAAEGSGGQRTAADGSVGDGVESSGGQLRAAAASSRLLASRSSVRDVDGRTRRCRLGLDAGVETRSNPRQHGVVQRHLWGKRGCQRAVTARGACSHPQKIKNKKIKSTQPAELSGSLASTALTFRLVAAR